jgi:replicative DNA helicase
LLILAGRPSMGKTALATNIAFHVARHYAWEPQPDGTKKTVNGGVVAFFSLEMSAEQLSMRLLADVSGVSSDRLRKGEIDASEFGRVRDAASRSRKRRCTSTRPVVSRSPRWWRVRAA